MVLTSNIRLKLEADMIAKVATRDRLENQAATRPSVSAGNWSHGSLRRLDLNVYKTQRSDLNLTKRVVDAASAANSKAGRPGTSEKSKASSRPTTAKTSFSHHTVIYLSSNVMKG